MARRVYKYPLFLGCNNLRMPKNAVPRHVAMQNGELWLWAEIDAKELEDDSYVFFVDGTGQDLPYRATKHIGTIQDGPCVWHVYQEE